MTGEKRFDEAADRLQRLEDIRAIEDLIHRYAWHVPRCEVEELVALFTDDGEFDSAGLILRGRQALRGYFAALSPNLSIPLIANILVDVEGDRATATCKMTTPWVGDGPSLVGYYEDAFSRSEGRWRFVRRRFRLHEHPAPGATIPNPPPTHVRK